MHPFFVFLLVGFLGGIGGVGNLLNRNEVALPGRDPASNVWRPGWVGTVGVGVIAAWVAWGLYGGDAGLLLSVHMSESKTTIQQLLSSIIIGFGGGKFLTTLSDKEAEAAASEDMRKVMKRILEQS